MFWRGAFCCLALKARYGWHFLKCSFACAAMQGQKNLSCMRSNMHSRPRWLQLWSGAGAMAKNTKRFIWPDLIQTLALVAIIVQCAHGTSNVQCPWHYLMFSAPGTITIFTVQLSASCWVGSGVTSLSRFPACLGDDLGTSHLAVGFLLVFAFPLGMEWILATQAQCPLTVDWAESSCPPMVCDGMAHCPILACWPHCKCHTFTAVLFWREINFHTTSCIGHQLADMCCWWSCWCLLSGGWLALSSSSWVSCLQALGSVHLPWAPSLGTRNWVLSWVYHPVWEGWLVH